MLSLELNGALIAGGVALTPNIELVATDGFTPRPAIKGPVVTETGMIPAITAITITVGETLRKRL